MILLLERLLRKWALSMSAIVQWSTRMRFLFLDCIIKLCLDLWRLILTLIIYAGPPVEVWPYEFSRNLTYSVLKLVICCYNLQQIVRVFERSPKISRHSKDFLRHFEHFLVPILRCVLSTFLFKYYWENWYGRQQFFCFSRLYVCNLLLPRAPALNLISAESNLS